MPQLISVLLSAVKCGVHFLAAFADLASGTALRPASSFFIGSPFRRLGTRRRLWVSHGRSVERRPPPDGAAQDNRAG
jgi:hypothetical protein